MTARLFALTLAALFLLPTQAEAQNEDGYAYVRYAIKQQRRCHRHVDMFGAVSYPCYYRPVRVREREYPNHRYRLPAGETYRYRAEDEPSAPRARCLWDVSPVQVSGEDKLEEERAQVSAQDHWSREVEVRYGTIFSDIQFAAQMTMACVRKVPGTATQTAQAAIGVRHHVCSLRAVPCAAPAERQDNDTRGKRRSEKADDEAGRRADPKARVDYYEAPPPPRRWYQRYRREN